MCANAANMPAQRLEHAPILRKLLHEIQHLAELPPHNALWMNLPTIHLPPCLAHPPSRSYTLQNHNSDPTKTPNPPTSSKNHFTSSLLFRADATQDAIRTSPEKVIRFECYDRVDVELFADVNVHEALFLFDHVEGIADVTLSDDDLSFEVFLELGGHGDGVDFVGFVDFSWILTCI